jgi:hypothetical protein
VGATDILEQLKTLPPGEQAAFDKLLRQWQSAHASPKSVARARQWPDFLTRLRNIYGNKTTGDSQSLISELRGER